MASTAKEATTDFAEHQKTYSAFLNLIKWSIVVIAIALIALFVVFVGNPYA